MSRLLALSGSLRAASFNTALARAARQHAPQGVQIEVATLHGIPLYDGDLEAKDGIPAAVLALKEKILASDGLLLVTPEYNSGVPGVFKNGIDWLSRADMKAVFLGLPVALLGASTGGFGTLSSQTAWLPTLKMLGVQLYSGASLTLARAHTAFDAQGELTDDRARGMLVTLLTGFDAFAQAHRR
jgi:NAD(P)H-dependent FMN reductase